MDFAFAGPVAPACRRSASRSIIQPLGEASRSAHSRRPTSGLTTNQALIAVARSDVRCPSNRAQALEIIGRNIEEALDLRGVQGPPASIRSAPGPVIRFRHQLAEIGVRRAGFRSAGKPPPEIGPTTAREYRLARRGAARVMQDQQLHQVGSLAGKIGRLDNEHGLRAGARFPWISTNKTLRRRKPPHAWQNRQRGIFEIGPQMARRAGKVRIADMIIHDVRNTPVGA